jgi:Predicted acetamidase/formamidase
MARTTVTYDDSHVYEFGPDMEPAYAADPGESLTVETVDSLEETIQTDDDLLDAIPDDVNAATGPIAVEGATPGDALVVEIHDVRLTEDRGRVVTTPGFGLLQDDTDVDHPATRVTPVSEDGQTVEFGEHSLAVDPLIGTIGVATREETHSTLVPHDHGGNLDTTDVTAGTTAYFPVFQPGGMLALGDAKAAMADGEMCGTGAEVAVEVDLTVDIVEPAVPIERPVLDTGDAWKTLASAADLETAVAQANRDMLDLLQSAHDFDRTDAYLFASLVGGLEISQVVDPLVTARNAVPREHLSDPL